MLAKLEEAHGNCMVPGNVVDDHNDAEGGGNAFAYVRTETIFEGVELLGCFLIYGQEAHAVVERSTDRLVGKGVISFLYLFIAGIWGS